LSIETEILVLADAAPSLEDIQQSRNAANSESARGVQENAAATNDPSMVWTRMWLKPSNQPVIVVREIAPEPLKSDSSSTTFLGTEHLVFLRGNAIEQVPPQGSLDGMSSDSCIIPFPLPEDVSPEILRRRPMWLCFTVYAVRGLCAPGRDADWKTVPVRLEISALNFGLDRQTIALREIDIPEDRQLWVSLKPSRGPEDGQAYQGATVFSSRVVTLTFTALDGEIVLMRTPAMCEKRCFNKTPVLYIAHDAGRDGPQSDAVFSFSGLCDAI
jgi:hypothetical protein